MEDSGAAGEADSREAVGEEEEVEEQEEVSRELETGSVPIRKSAFTACI